MDRLYLAENKLKEEDGEEILAEIQKTAWEIKELTLREKLKIISLELRQNNNSQDLEKDFTEVTNRLQKLLGEKELLTSASA